MEALSLLEMTPANELSLYRNLCIESFAFFVQHFWDEVPSSEPLEWNWHMEVLCNEMENPAKRVFQGLPVIYDTIFNVPFGTSKSTICSILFQPWTWTFFPRSRHMTGTHTEPLGSDLSSKSKAVIESDKYKHYFSHVVLDKKSDDHFTNTAGGERRICTVGGKTPTGFHAHFLGVDDPIDPKGAMSEAELDNAAQFIERVLPSRKVNKEVAWTYLVMQRLGRGDPSEVMWKAGQKEGAIPVRRVVLPGELSDDVFPPEAKVYYERSGGLLDPKRLSKKVLDNYRSKGAYFYSSQVMQNPMALGGGMFKEHYFNQRVKAAPYHAKRIRYWDRACLVKNTMIATSKGEKPIQDIKAGEFVLTRQGYKRVKWAGLTKFAETIQVEFSNGSILEGTPEHKIWTENRGWVRLDSILSNDYNVCIIKEEELCKKEKARRENWIQKLLSSRGLFIREDLEKGISKPIDGIESKNGIGLILYIGLYGGIIKEKFQKALTCIIRMGIGMIMKFPIFNALQEKNIIESMALLWNGIPQKRLTNCVGGMWKKHGEMPLIKNTFVSNAAINSNREELTNHLNIALFYVGNGLDLELFPSSANNVNEIFGEDREHFAVLKYAPISIGEPFVSGAKTNFKRDIQVKCFAPKVVEQKANGPVAVYDLEVEDAHEFFANGILVHNSTADGGCYTAGVLMAFYEGNYYVEHVVHGQWEPDERNKIMRATALRDRTRYGPRNDPEIWVEAEGGSSGRDAWKGVARALAGFRVKEDKVTGAKDTRAEPWSCQCAAGNVYLVEDGTWDIGTYVEEHCLFKPEPGKRLGKFKDQVDGSSGAFNLLTGKGSGPSQIRILFSNSKRKGLKIVVCSRRDLPSVVVEDRPCILITVVDPDPYNNDREERNGFQNDKEQGVGYVAAHSQSADVSQLNTLNETRGQENSINGEVDHASNHLAELKSENHVEGKLPSPQHGLSKLVASVEIQFADISPAEVQDTWNEIVESWGVTASDLVMKPEHGKKLWAAVVKRRDVPMETIVIADDGDRRAESIAKGICDSLGLKRADTIWFVGDEENQGGADPGNKHVYDMVKTSRVLVV